MRNKWKKMIGFIDKLVLFDDSDVKDMVAESLIAILQYHDFKFHKIRNEIFKVCFS